MADPLHPTNSEWVLFDPEIHPPPRGVNLVMVTRGGVLIVGQWCADAVAWGYKPRVPSTVKAREIQTLREQKQQNEVLHASQPEGGATDPA